MADNDTQMNRRSFLGKSVATAAATLLPHTALGGSRQVTPSERINVGYVGLGTQGIRHLIPALQHEQLRITAVCDPNRQSADYVEWYPDELRGKVQEFLGDPSWGRGDGSCPCGRETGRELVDRHYGASPGGGCHTYADFREMLAKEQDLDAVYIMTPDHLHATIALAAMQAGKHVICHKPLGNVVREARLVADMAGQTGLATHMFCAAGLDSTPLLCEWIWNGAIGGVREVHNWSTRPYWPQGMTSLPSETPQVPESLDWDLWLGPIPHRPYHPAYTNAVFRGWYDFGTGALGDMGHYSFFQIFKILKLGAPQSVEASRSQFWEIDNLFWVRQRTDLAYPQASSIRWEFPARNDMPAVTLHWYDGGLRPPLISELEQDGEQMPEEGLLFVGDTGKILAGFNGREPRLIPKAAMDRFQPPQETLPRPAEELEQWVQACQGGPSSDASFEQVYPFSEAILIGNIALRIPGKLRWDAATTRFIDAPEADALMTRAYRKGWEL
jgi:predicted dehydrogenase